MSILPRHALSLLTDYARYHRDRRNILTHLVGVPMIVFAIGVLLSRPLVDVGPLSVTPAVAMCVLTGAWYLTRGHLGVGLAVTAMVALLVALAHQLAWSGHGSWLAWGVGLFVIGWIIQLVGHYYEGRKPAFVDDLVGLLVGPMFVALELLVALGLLRDVQEHIEAQAGPTHLRDLAHPAA